MLLFHFTCISEWQANLTYAVVQSGELKRWYFQIGLLQELKKEKDSPIVYLH